MIQKNFFQTWREENLSSYSDGEIGAKSRNSILKFFKDYEYKLWTDEEMYSFMDAQPPLWKNTFYNLNHHIKKVDFFRYALIYNFGGFYSDLDFVFLRALPSQINSYDFVSYKANRNIELRSDCFEEDSEGKWVIGQAFFGAPKKSHHLKCILDEISFSFNSDDNPLLDTGPDRLNKIFRKRSLYKTNIYIFNMSDFGNNDGAYANHYTRSVWV
jgi:hypothetical protein